LLVKVGCKTLNVGSFQGANGHYRNLSLCFAIDLSADLGKPLRRSGIQHAGKVVDVTSGLELLELIAVQGTTQRQDCQKEQNRSLELALEHERTL
jgi:hypothetical protein